MFQQAKWFGLSLVLHLAVAGSLVLTASRTVDRTPRAIMVVLDSYVPTGASQRKASLALPLTAAKRAAPAIPAEPVKPEKMHQLQPAAPQVSSTIPTPEKSQSSKPPEAAESPAVSASRPKADGAISAPVSPAKVPLPLAAADERPAQEKAKQRYLKEHFAYIRDLVTKRLAYPPMARKMRWSGKVLVAFVIAEDGTVHNLRVVESSGFQILDKSATETVQNVAPFPKPPVRAEIMLPINFKMM